MKGYLPKIIIVIFLLSQFCFASKTNTVKGKITDSQTGEPVTNVNVFLAHTLIGTTTSSSGEFLMKIPNDDSYELVVSHIQYNTQKETIKLQNGKTFHLDYKLEPKIYELPEVSVEDDSEEWWDYFNKFKKELLGFTPNTDSCEILNPFEVGFESIGIDNFTASANQALYIVNKSLGYRITYYLESFHADKGVTKITGTPFFQQLYTESDSLKKYWEENRVKTYNGSLRDFLTFLCAHEKLNQDDFDEDELDFLILLLHKPDAKYIKEAYYPIDDLSEYVFPTNEEKIYKISFPDRVKVYYHNINNKPTNFERFGEFFIPGESTNIDFLGRNHEKFGIKTMGYWGKQRLADMLPLEYFPDEELLVRK